MDYMTKQENYIDRRQLFKDIWDTAMNIDDNDAASDILNKPNAVKTLRLDEVDRCVVGKKKKQRIKNLRTVCNKILKFCDRQETEDCFYEQYATQSNELPTIEQTKKLKLVRKRKKIKKAKSLFTPAVDNLQTKSTVKPGRTTAPVKPQRTSILRNSSVFDTPPRAKAPIKVETNLFGDSANRRSKVIKKKSLKTTKP